METVGYAALQIVPTTKGLASSLSSQVGTPMSKVGASAGATAGAGYKKSFLGGLKGIAGPVAGLVGITAGISVFGDMISEGREAGKVARQTEQLIKSTGGTAGLTASQVSDLAGKLSDYAAVDDELIQQGQNVLLTFKNVQNQVGEGNAVFDRASKAALDLSSVLGTDVQGSMLQLGKALNDPLKGITALGRAGVSFTQQQKDQIAALVESNDLLGAQKIILREVEGEVGGAAGASKDSIDELGVAFKNLEESVGTLLLPAIDGLATVAANDLIPAISATGGAVGDLASAFSDLPGPVKAAAVSLGTIALINKTIGFGALTSGAARATSAFDGLRLRTMLASDAFRSARTYSLQLDGNLGKISPSLSRTASAMAATRAATVGLGSALKTSLGGVVGALGGPWGIALAGAAVGLSIFASRSQEAASRHAELEARVKSISDALDQQTGAITANARETARKELADSGAFDAADKLGINLNLVTKAALGNKDAIEQVNKALLSVPKQDIFDDGSLSASGQALVTLQGELGLTTNAIDDQRSKIEQMNRSRENDDTTTIRYTTSIKALKEELYGDQKAADAARRAHDRLADALSNAISGNINYKQSVADANQIFVDRKKLFADLATAQRDLDKADTKSERQSAQSQIADIRAQLADLTVTLNTNTQSGRDNMNRLLDVAGAWNDLGDKAQGVKGKFAGVHDQFVKLAESLGASEQKAKRLADRLLDLPKRTIDIPIKLHIVGTGKGRQQGVALPGFADGGYVGGSGIGDKQLILADSREYIVKPSAAAYWGPEFLKAINNKRMPPQMAQGGPVSPSPSRSSSGVNITVGEVRAHNYQDFMTQMQRRARASASSELPMAGMG